MSIFRFVSKKKDISFEQDTDECQADGDNMITKAGCSYKQTTLHYNIALNVTDEGSSGGKIGVLGGFFGGLSENAAKNQSGALTSLDFQLDVLLPQG